MNDLATALRAEVDAAAARLRSMTEAEAARERGAAKWAKKEILGHLIDSAANNHQRFVRGQMSGTLITPGYAQEHWVSSQRYGERPWPALVALWAAYNRHLAHVLTHLPDTYGSVPVQIGRDAPVTLDFVARDYVDHLRHHLAQIFAV